jgi:hypothetical protein
MLNDQKKALTSRQKNGKKGAAKRMKTLANRKAVAEMSVCIQPSEPDRQVTPDESLNLIDTLCEDADPRMAARLRAYHRTVGDPTDWPACQKVEQVMGEAVKNQGNQIDLDRARGRLIDRKELKTAVAVVRDSWWIEAQQISQRVLQRLSTLSIDDRALVKNSIESEVRICAERAKARSLESES